MYKKIVSAIISSVLASLFITMYLNLYYSGRLFTDYFYPFFSVLAWSAPILLLYGVPVAMLVDAIGRRFSGMPRMWLALVMFMLFGIGFGMVIPSNIEVMLFGGKVDLLVIAGGISAIIFWLVEECTACILDRNWFQQGASWKRWALFLIGFLLFLLSIPQLTVMTIEKVSSNVLYERYDIFDPANRYPTPGSNFTVMDHSIAVEEANYRDSDYETIQGYPIAFADLTIKLNGEKLFDLEDATLVEEFDGIARYRQAITFLLLRDNKTVEDNLYMITRDTEDTFRGGIIYDPPLESSDFTIHRINQLGERTVRTFSFTERTPVETILLNNSGTIPTGIGHYSQAFHVYPSIGFPIFYPFATTIISLFLLVRFRPKRKR